MWWVIAVAVAVRAAVRGVRFWNQQPKGRRWTVNGEGGVELGVWEPNCAGSRVARFRNARRLEVGKPATQQSKAAKTSARSENANEISHTTPFRFAVGPGMVSDFWGRDLR